MKTIIPAHITTNIRLTTMTTKAFNVVTYLLCVLTAGRWAVSQEVVPAFFIRRKEESAERPFGTQPGQASPTPGANRFMPKKRHPAQAGCQMKGVFGAGALLPQFLTELTNTLNSRIWNYYSISARPRQA